MRAPSITPLTNQILINFGEVLQQNSLVTDIDTCYIFGKCGIVKVFIYFRVFNEAVRILDKCTSISRRQKAGQDINMKIANRSFGNVAK